MKGEKMAYNKKEEEIEMVKQFEESNEKLKESFEEFQNEIEDDVPSVSNLREELNEVDEKLKRIEAIKNGRDGDKEKD